MSARARSLAAIVLACGVVALLLVLRASWTLDVQEVLTTQGEGDSRTYEGSWHFPRGGPYLIGFEAQSGASLFVDGVLVVRGTGLQSKRKVYQAGTHALKIEAEHGFRLLWHPPGRRGPLEYVPNSSLSGLGPGDARFHQPGTSREDGWVALGILLTLLSLLAFLKREAVSRCDRRVALLMVMATVAAFAIRWVGLDAQGQTWDEDVNWSAGRNYVTNLLSLDFSESSWRWNYEHPPVMKYLAGIGAQFSDGYSPSRAISALLASLACGLLVPIGGRLLNLRVGLVAAGIAALSPHLIAHSKVVGHEAPTMFFWSLAIWLSLRAHDTSADPYKFHKRLAVLGVVLGLSVFSRYINGLLAPLIGAILLVQAPADKRRQTILLGLAILPIAATLTCFLVWPRMWSQPLMHMQESWAKLKKPHGLEPYLGVMTQAPGPSYFFVYLWATVPLGVLILAKVWLARLVWLREKASLTVLLWLLIPLVVTFSPVRQDGVRYVMPSLLALSMAAAMGLEWLTQLSKRVCLWWVLPSGVFYMAIVCFRIHPFYLDYYGEQVGGPARVAKDKRFEIAWWGEGMNQALDYLNRHAPTGARVYKRCFEPGHLAWMRGDLWKTEAREPSKADWFLVYQPSLRSCPIPKDSKLVFEARAQGAPLARVYRRLEP